MNRAQCIAVFIVTQAVIWSIKPICQWLFK